MTLLALTREISPAIVHCELTHLERVPIDLARARAEHEAYEDALRALSVRVERLASDATMPDSVFIEDTAIVLDELAVITRPGAPSRRAETEAVAAALRPLRELASIVAPGTLDGGDVVRLGRRLLVGVGARSNEDGVRQLRALVAPSGYAVEGVRFRDCLHLKSAVTSLADDVVLLNPKWVDLEELGAVRGIEIDAGEPYAANALRVGDDIVFSAEFERTRRLIEAAGFSVHTVPAGELAKAEGAVTCCSLMLEV